MREIAHGEETPQKDEVEYLKTVFYKMHVAEREAKLRDFLDAGGAPEQYQVVPDEAEEAFKAEMSIIKERRQQMFREQEAEKEENLKKKLDIIEKIKAMVTSPEEAKAAFERFGVDAVMGGRATFGRPWTFREIRRLLDGEPADPDMDFAWKLGILEEQLRINVERIDEYRGILHTRRHLAASPIFKGIPNFRPTRIAMLKAERLDELKAILDELRRNPPQPITT